MDIQPNTLVLIIGQQDILRKPTWGIIKTKCGDDSYHVGVPKMKLRPSVFLDFVVAKTAELIPVAQTDRGVMDPKKAFKSNIDLVLANLLIKIMSAVEAKPAPAEIETGTLVIILEERGQKNKWGLVKKTMPGGKLMVIVGEKWFRAKTILVSKNGVVPVILTNGKTHSPRKAFFRNIQEITIKVLIGIEDLKKKETRT